MSRKVRYKKGKLAFESLEEIDLETGLPTGKTKPNIEGDPDYIPPTVNETECPTIIEDI